MIWIALIKSSDFEAFVSGQTMGSWLEIFQFLIILFSYVFVFIQFSSDHWWLFKLSFSTFWRWANLIKLLADRFDSNSTSKNLPLFCCFCCESKIFNGKSFFLRCSRRLGLILSKEICMHLYKVVATGNQIIQFIQFIISKLMTWSIHANCFCHVIEMVTSEPRFGCNWVKQLRISQIKTITFIACNSSAYGYSFSPTSTLCLYTQQCRRSELRAEWTFYRSGDYCCNMVKMQWDERGEKIILRGRWGT